MLSKLSNLPIPSATVVLVRDSDVGMQTLLLRRNAELAFAGGSWVFPGGRLDAVDSVSTCASLFEEQAGRPLGEFEAAKKAAVRETLEETGLVIDASKMVYFAHWLAPPFLAKRFSTWFFITVVDESVADSVQIDEGEIHESCWLSASKILANVADSSMNLLPPTIVTLLELARYNNTQDLMAYYHDRQPVVFRPHVYSEAEVTELSGQRIFLYSGDAGYETTDPSLAGLRHRLILDNGQWRYENTVYD